LLDDLYVNFFSSLPLTHAHDTSTHRKQKAFPDKAYENSYYIIYMIPWWWW